MGASSKPSVTQVTTREVPEDRAPGPDDRDLSRLLTRGRNATKADVVVYRTPTGEVAVKDYASRPWWIRHTLGRYLIARETRAYLAAGLIPGVLEFLGRRDPFSLATRFVDAQPLSTHSAPDGSCFDRLDAIVGALHRRGVALGDLHHRNVLLGPQGSVYIVDLATAWVAGPRPGRARRWVFDRFCDLDRIALARLRARAVGRDPDTAVDDVGGAAARWYRRGRRVRRLRDRLRRLRSR